MRTEWVAGAPILQSHINSGFALNYVRTCGLAAFAPINRYRGGGDNGLRIKMYIYSVRLPLLLLRVR